MTLNEAAIQFDLIGADNIARHFNVPTETLVISWRRYDPPVPLVRVEGQLCANAKEISGWMQAQGITVVERRGGTHHGRAL